MTAATSGPTDWSAASDADYARLKGKTVYTSDDEEVGTISAVYHPPRLEKGTHLQTAHYFLIDESQLTGPGSAGELYMPNSAIQDVDGDRVIASWPRDELENQGWASRPAMIDEARQS